MCGLAGIISTEKSLFDLNSFNILGTLNDERGGDSCGVFIDGYTDYGIKKDAYFRNFTINKKYPKEASIALLHCRRASNGYRVTEQQAQPVIISNNNIPEFVLLHNGTITNIQTLASKYFPEKRFFDMSDSQILTQIIYKYGYKVLEEYEGTAVIITVDYRKGEPSIIMFRGNSCYNEINSNSERPLFYMVYDNKFYFSSMFSSLYLISRNTTIYELPTNKLCKITKNKIRTLTDVNRGKLTKRIVYSSDYLNLGFNYKSSTNPNNRNSILYEKDTGLYKLGDTLAHGEIEAYPSGLLASANYGEKYYFFNGRLLYNKSCFDFLDRLSELYTEDVFIDIFPQSIDYFAYGPRLIKGTYKKVDDSFNYVNYDNGSFAILFNYPQKINITQGNISISYIYPADAKNIYKNDCSKISFNFDELENTVLTSINSLLIDTSNGSNI